MAIYLKEEKIYWYGSPEKVLQYQNTSRSGLSDNDIKLRHSKFGLNVIRKKNINFLLILLRQLTGNPLIIILASAALISFFLGEKTSSIYIFWMIIISVILGFWNEYSAEKSVDDLLNKITPTTLVIRNNEKLSIPITHLTPGDIVILTQGNIIPADMRLIETKNLVVNQAALTGESNSIHKSEKEINDFPHNLFGLNNIGFMGTSVESGMGYGVVIAVGEATEYGKIAESVTYLKPVTEFQKGLSQFGTMIMKVIFILTVFIFGLNAFIGHALLEALLFSLAIAVGLTPELLPVIVTICLSHGAGKLAKKHVVAKRLLSIENLGNMDVLCTDKTGTLTEGKIRLAELKPYGKYSADELFQNALICNNAVVHHQVIGDGIDTALWEYAIKKNISQNKFNRKLDEEPFDFEKKAMYAVVQDGTGCKLIVKGAPESVFPLCSNIKKTDDIKKVYRMLCSNEYRVIAVAQKEITKKTDYSWNDASNINFMGLITFYDTPKKSADEAIKRLRTLNVQTKVITGDSAIIAKKICERVGMDTDTIITGEMLDRMQDSEVEKIMTKADIFSRVTPEQKLRIIRILQGMGHTVGYLGDGINDIPALHSADVGISVNCAVDIAKDAASVVLMRKSLDVLAEGIIEGRKTFNNTIKYILMGTSSNFGNMLSAAGASVFLPFLPMTPLQILFNNSLYDISQMGIPTDNVDHESLLKPRHWNISFIKNYMLFFGPISTVYDFLTFGILLYLFKANASFFQTGWFIESLATQTMVIFVIRTARSPFFKSRPSIWLTVTCLGIIVTGIAVTLSPLARIFGLIPLPPLYFFVLIVIVVTYLFLVEGLKKIFLKKFSL